MWEKTINRYAILSLLFATQLVSAGGVVIPMYIDPAAPVAYVGRYTDAVTGQLVTSGTKPGGRYYTGLEVWEIVARGAAMITTSKSHQHRDYFVVANGPANGPFSIPLDPAVTSSFNNVRANGGKIFGYVHTLITPSSQVFRSLESVKADITSWAEGYPHIDGFFLDEFAPIYEINGANPSLGPTDPNADTISGQINPAGGYYHQLIEWIRARYPNAKIIANPGGRVYSNQYLWNNLADITCTFENSLAAAAGDQEWYASQGTPWSNLTRESTFTTTKQAALIHSNTANFKDAVYYAYASGYDYVYTVQAVPAYDNTWGIMPAYFTQMLHKIAKRR